MESFSANDALAGLEGRLKMKLVPSGFLRFCDLQLSSTGQ